MICPFVCFKSRMYMSPFPNSPRARPSRSKICRMQEVAVQRTRQSDNTRRAAARPVQAARGEPRGARRALGWLLPEMTMNWSPEGLHDTERICAQSGERNEALLGSRFASYSSHRVDR